MSSNHVPAIIHTSTETYRMYKAMCMESEDQEPKAGSKRKETVFSSFGQAFFLAAAVGLINDSKLEVTEKKAQLLRWEQIRNSKNYGPFRQLVKSKFNLKSEREIADLMVQYAEAGIRELYDEYHKTGGINFLQLFRRVTA